MSWARYDDEFPSNWKVSTLAAQGVEGIAALGLHVLANCWTRNQGLGGFVPDFKPGQLIGDAKLGARLAARLEEVGMFDPTESGWLIHDFDEYSDPNDDGTPASEKKRRISEARRAAGSKGGKAKAAKQTASKPPSKPLANGWQTSSPDPVPDPVPSVGSSSTTHHHQHGPSPDDDAGDPRFQAVLGALVDARIERWPSKSNALAHRTTVTQSVLKQHGDTIREFLAARPDHPTDLCIKALAAREIA